MANAGPTQILIVFPYLRKSDVVILKISEIRKFTKLIQILVRFIDPTRKRYVIAQCN